MPDETISPKNPVASNDELSLDVDWSDMPEFDTVDDLSVNFDEMLEFDELDLSVDFSDMPDFSEEVDWSENPFKEYNPLSDRSYLKSKGFIVPEDAEDKQIKLFAMSIRSAQAKGIDLNFSKMTEEFNKGHTGLIRSELDDREIERLLKLIDIENSENAQGSLAQIFEIPSEERFDFSRASESHKYDLTRVFYDVETNAKGHASAMECYNSKARRITLWKYSKKRYKFEEFIQPDGSIFQIIESLNPFDGFIGNDIELFVGVTLTSALQEGNSELMSIFKEIRRFKQIMRPEILREILYDQRKSVWVAHNSPFDLDKCLYRHRKANRKLSHLRTPEPKTIKLHNIYRQDEYSLAVGNSKIGFRFYVTTDSRLSFRKITRVTVAPHQANSFSFCWSLDTLTCSIAFQNPAHSLLKLSEGTKYEKIEYATEKKVFDPEDFYIKDSSISPALEYLHYDCLSLASVYERLTHQLNYPILERTLDIDIEPSIKPELARILSPASMSKKSLFGLLKKETGLFRRNIENNIVHERQYLKNHEENYLGARVEVFTYGRACETLQKFKFIENLKEKDLYREEIENMVFYDEFVYASQLTQIYTSEELEKVIPIFEEYLEKIFYDDYASLYPHTAYLTQAFLQLKLASERKLHKYVKYDSRAIHHRLFKRLYHISEKIKKGQPFERDIFEGLLGNVTFETSLPLQIPTRSTQKGTVGKRQEVRASGIMSLSIIDLLTALIREHIANGISIVKLRKAVKIKKAEYFDFPKIEEYGQEFFSRLYVLRLGIKKMMKLQRNGYLTKESLKEVKSDLSKIVTSDEVLKILVENIDELWDEVGELTSLQKALEQLLKYIMNSAYGVTAEGISYEDFTGKLFIPSIANLITAGARFLSSTLEVLVKFYGGIPLDSDTDSLMYKTTKSRAKKIRSHFDLICELKNETDYGDIQSFATVGKKKYGMRTRFMKCSACEIENLPTSMKECPECRDPLELYYDLKFKTHGKSQYPSKTWKDALRTHYGMVLTPDENGEYPTWSNHLEYAKISSQKLSVWKQVDLKHTGARSRHSIVRGLRPFFHDVRGLLLDEFTYRGLKLSLRYDLINDNLLVTNTDELSNSSFGYYWKSTRKLKHNIRFWICTVLPELEDSEEGDYTDEFDRLVEFVYNRYYPKFKGIEDKLELTKNKNLKISGKEFSLRSIFGELKSLFVRIYDKILNSRDTKEMNKYLTKINKKRKEEGKKTKVGLATVKAFSERIYEMYHKEIKDREHLVQKMANYFRFDKKRFMRNREKVSDEFSVMHVMGASAKQNNEPILDLVSTQKILTDGFTYHQSFGLPSLDFSSDTLANQNSYYETAILNLSYVASKIYYATHRNLPCIYKEECSIKKCKSGKCDHPEHDKPIYNHQCAPVYKHDMKKCKDNCPIRDLAHKKKTEMPCPHKNRTVYIPLHIKPLIQPYFRYHEKTGKLVDIKIWDKQLVNVDPLVIQKIEEYLIKHPSRPYYYLPEIQDDRKKALKKIPKILQKYNEKNVYLEIDFLDKKWGIEIMSHNSMTTNASLIIEIPVQKQGWNNTRLFMSHLHLNPNSRALLNIELFETSIEKLEDNSEAFHPLIRSLFDDLDVTVFSRNASATLDDYKIKKDMGYVRKQTYTTMAHNILRERAHQRINTKLGEIAVTNQIKIPDNLDPDVFMSLIKTSALKRFQSEIDKLQDTKRALEKKKTHNLFEHKSSNGMTFQNWTEHYAISCYLKDHRWYTNKVTRLANRREPTLQQMEAIRERLESYDWSKNNYLRFEITFFGFDILHSQETASIMKELEEWITSLVERLQNTESFKEFSEIVNEWSDKVPHALHTTFSATPIFDSSDSSDPPD